MCCASRFCMGGRGAAGSRSKNLLEGAMKQNASPGEQSEAPRRRRKPGQKQHPGPENQDSQHMLDQPRGSFSEKNISAVEVWRCASLAGGAPKGAQVKAEKAPGVIWSTTTCPEHPGSTPMSYSTSGSPPSGTNVP